ncbi:MAG: bifunctional folylpolyglutamate synthase/dihydrofolate synthase [Synergistaceae bacterium]|jgi:dihydrofolate synthase/folylpolyglutamate synthase|nr:bifunctional folylpolyglutamate synthase/dihydrofolate synthase [Synergistaceae bacterium]
MTESFDGISFDDVEKLVARYASPGIRPGLERAERLLSLLGDPQRAYPSVHVVGTNGKGSTCAMLDSVFRAAGYRTALYTSPHLESPGERLLIDGKPLTPARWMAAVEKTVAALESDPALRSDPPSYFELVTAAAFLLAKEERVEFAVVEAGLGGRLDATNLLGDVACSVVCSISMDHTEYLGDALEKIAGEKFAVARPAKPACYLGDAPGLIPLFEEFCARVNAVPFVVGRDAVVGAATVTETGCVFDFSMFSAGGLNLSGVRTGLTGRYQVSNAALALLTLSRLTERFGRLTEPAIRAGLLSARWPGRLEIVSRAPTVVLDGGHNLDGVTKLVESLAELWGDRRIGLVYGVMKDKDYPACLEILNGLRGSNGEAPSFCATQVPGMERSLAADVLAERARQMKWTGAVEGYENPLDAIERASGENDVVVVCGSLYLIGWVRPKLLAAGGVLADGENVPR